MPLNEYVCEKCKAQTEILQSFKDRVPVCCGQPMKKKLSNFGFSFGWRLTDESHNVRFHKDDWEKDV